MKKIIFAISLSIVASVTSAQVYPRQNISLLGTLSPCTVNNWYATGSNTKYSSVIGWSNPVDSKEYAILGGTDGYYFIEVTNPTTPTLRDFEPGINTSALWREMKTFGNYCYMVSDDSNPNGFIIADLSYLPDSIHVVHKGNTILNRAHTVFVDGNKLYFGGMDVPALGPRSMGVYDLSNPVNPTPIRYLNQDYPSINYVHDMWVQNDTVFASCGNQGLHIYKLNTNNTFSELASYTMYVQSGYNHSSYRTENKKTLVFCDEVPTNTVVKILDVSNLANLTLLDTIKSNQGATPHNPYIIGDTLALVAYYQDGLYAFDISDPANVSVAGYFDTHYQNGVNNNFPGTPTSYMGAWAAWPYLPSGNVLVSDMQNGLFVLDIDSLVATGIKKTNSTEINFTLFPNPSSDKIQLTIMNEKGNAEVEITDIQGKKIFSEQFKIEGVLHFWKKEIKDLGKGIYFLHLKCGGKITTKEFIRE